MREWTARLARFVVILMAIFTFVGLVAEDQWWIRVFDFPRVHMAVLLVLALAFLAITESRRIALWSVVGIAALAYHLVQLVPYTPMAPKEVVDAGTCADGDTIHLVSLNVLQDNRDFAATIRYVQEEDPDIFLAMENDAAWTDALSAALDEAYPHSLKLPQDNTYGMALWSRLPLRDLERNELAGGGTPSIRARIEMPDGSLSTIFAVHPRPPHPGQDSGQRDAELILLADLVRNSDRPTIVVGDFNDVPWSSVTGTFRRVGQVLDPRIGRGYMASFDATSSFLRWPLDHTFLTEDFGVIRYELGPDVGSDHFPLELVLCRQPARFAPQQDAPELTEGAIEDAREELEDASEGGDGPDAENLTVEDDGDDAEAYAPQ